MRLFSHLVSLFSPHKHRISISDLKIFAKNLRGENPEVNKRLKIWVNNLRAPTPKVTDFERKVPMENITKKYEAAVNCAAEISQVILDMEGGRFVLSMFSELLMNLLGEGNLAGAMTVLQKLCEVSEVPFVELELEEDDPSVWTTLFADALIDVIEESIFF